MNPAELTALVRQSELEFDDCFELRIKFGIACIERVEHLLTDDDVIALLAIGKKFLDGECGLTVLDHAAASAAQAARSHAGSNSLDGTGNAAVSTSYGVAAALAGRALQAAEYAAYASVYSYSSHAVTDLANYRDEHDWQIRKLTELLAAATAR